jgi:hypothetical protein
MKSGREFKLRIYWALKGEIDALLSVKPMRAVELMESMNLTREANKQCTINQVVAALVDMEREGIVFSRGDRKAGKYWHKNPPEVVERRSRGEGAVKVYRMDDVGGIG